MVLQTQAGGKFDRVVNAFHHFLAGRWAPYVKKRVCVGEQSIDYSSEIGGGIHSVASKQQRSVVSELTLQTIPITSDEVGEMLQLPFGQLP